MIDGCPTTATLSSIIVFFVCLQSITTAVCLICFLGWKSRKKEEEVKEKFNSSPSSYSSVLKKM